MESSLRWREKYVKFYIFETICNDTNARLVTDMLLAMLNCCTKEELEESSDEEALISPSTPAEDSAERRKVIKNKILAVGRISRVFALLRFVKFQVQRFLTQSDVGCREESEKVSELKSMSGSAKLPYGTLVLGAEGIKDAITGFEDAYVYDLNEVLMSKLTHYQAQIGY